MYIRHSHPFHSLHHMNDDDDDDMIVIIKLSLKQDTLPGLPIVSCDRAVLVNSTRGGGGRGRRGREGKGKVSYMWSFTRNAVRFPLFPFVSGIRMMNWIDWYRGKGIYSIYFSCPLRLSLVFVKERRMSFIEVRYLESKRGKERNQVARS